MSNETQDSYPLSQFQPLEAILDPVDNSFRLISTISSANFDGVIPDTIIAYPTATTSDIIPGRHILIGESFCIVTRIYENIDPSTTDTLSYEIYFIENNLEKSKTILSSVNTFTDGTELVVRKDDWNGKSLGESGWTITTEGNSVFSNVAVRGRIEATEGYFDGRLFVGDPLDPDSPGSMRMGTNVDGTLESPGTQDGIFINTNNYWYDTGLFSIGNGTAGVVWNGSALAITGQVTATSGTIGGFNIGATSLTAGTESNSVGLAPGTFPFFAGSATPASAPFRVNTAGALTATGATITGAITATSGTFTGTVNANSGTFTSTVTIGGATSGTLEVGTGTNKIKIIGTSLDSTTYINTGSTTATTGNGFYFGADGKVRIASATNSLTFDGTSLTINGGGTFTGSLSIGTGNSIFKADTNGIYLGNATFASAPFRVTPAGALTATNATITGAITASSGSFTGTVNILSGGSLVAGNTTDGVTVDSTGIYGYEQGSEIFSIPTSSSLTPTIASFKIVETTLYSDGLDANLVVGTRGYAGVISSGTVGSVTVDGSFKTATITGMTNATNLVVGQTITATTGTGTIPAGTIVKKINSSTSISIASLNTIIAGTVTSITGVGGNSIQIRGQDSGGASPTTPAAIFTTISGTTTTATTNNGFYVDRTGKFRLAGANGSVTMDGSGNLIATGQIRATSGYIGGTTNGWTIGSNLLSNGNVGFHSPATTTGEVAIYAGDTFSNRQTAPFRVKYDGSIFATNAEITGTINATSGTIGTDSPWTITGGKISSGLAETFIGLQTSLNAEPETYSLNLDSIVIDNEGSGNSTIYMVVDDAPTTLIDQGELLTLSIPANSISLTINADETKLTNYLWTVWDVSTDQYSIVSGSASVSGTLPAGKVTLMIYGEDNGETFIDESKSFTGSETVTVNTSSSENTGIWVGNSVFTSAPFSVNSQGLMKASSGSIGGFDFESSDNGGSFLSKGLGLFDKGVYSPPYSIELSPTDGIILNVNKSLGDAVAYLIEESDPEITYPTNELGYQNILRSTGFAIVDNTGAASNVTMNPYMGIRSESVSALNIAKNGSFEYKVGASAYTYSGSGWTAGSGLTLASLSATTAGYSFPALPYGQQFVGKLSWTTAVSTFLTTQFLVDPGGFQENYPSPLDPTTYLSVGDNSISSGFAVYNSQPDGLFGASHYVAAYPVQDLKVTFTDADGITQTINPFDGSYIGVSDMLQNIVDVSPSNIDFANGYLYLSAPYTENILSFAVTATSGIVVDEDGYGDGSATLTIGAHPFYAGQYVSLFNGSTDLGEEDTFQILSVTATQIVVDDSSYNITGVNTVKSDGSPVYSSSSTRGKNEISFTINSDDYLDANNSLPYTLHLPGYYYGVTFDTVTSQTATFSRAQSGTLALTVSSGIDVVFTEVGNPDATYDSLSTTGISSSATTLNFASLLPGIGPYDLHEDYYNPSYSSYDYSSSSTSIIVYGDMTAYHTVNSFALIYETLEYIKVTARSYNADNDETTLTVLRGQLSSTASEFFTDNTIYAIERVNVTNLVENSSSYFNLDKALFDSVSNEVIPTIGAKVSNSSIAFDELFISDGPISYFDGDTGGGAVWGVDASQPATWSYRPSAVIAQLGGNPLAIGNNPGLQLIKQLSYEPYTYLLENPSVTVQQWDTDTSQSALVISGGKFSVSSTEPRIELVSGTSATNSGRVNIDSKNLYITGVTSITGATSITGNTSISGTLSATGALTAPSLTATGRIKGTANYKEAGYTGARGASSTYLAAATVSLTGVSANSSVLLMATGSFNPSTSNTYVNVYITRGASRISYVGTVQASASGNNQPLALAVIDASAATGTQAYTVYMRALNGTADWGADTGGLRLTALELF